jgi:hypothetical protein
VENFLGARIDHFVEVTLVGFYDLAQALGSVTVCLNGPTQDDYSGARFAKGYQQLNAAQALAFVRQRRDYVHPELNFTDLDRARRQQAFLASAGYQLNSAGTLANPARIHDLIEVATKDIVIDNGLDLLGFAEQAPRLLGGGLTFTTLPVKAFSTIDGQDVNLVDDAQIKSVVRGLLGSDDANTPSTGLAPQLPAGTLDIINGSGRNGLATTLNRALARRGLTPGTANTDRVTRNHTTLSYSPDAQPAAQALAELLNQPQPRPSPPGPWHRLHHSDRTHHHPRRQQRRSHPRQHHQRDTRQQHPHHRNPLCEIARAARVHILQALGYRVTLERAPSLPTWVEAPTP